MYRPALTAAIVLALIGVITGAMGAHALKEYLSATVKDHDLSAGLLSSYETAVRYQFYHSFALALAGILHLSFANAWIRRATWMFLAGTILFSGSIYLLVFLKATGDVGLRQLGILTPIGGVCFILGWASLLVGINRKP